MSVDFLLPDLGEGLTESEIVSWHVVEGEAVRLNQIIAEVETAKAIVEPPSPYSGTVARLYAEPGVVITVGEPIIAFDLEGDGAASGNPVTDAPAPHLVGYGAKAEAAVPRRRARTAAFAAVGAANGASAPAAAIAAGATAESAANAGAATAETAANAAAAAHPAMAVEPGARGAATPVAPLERGAAAGTVASRRGAAERPLSTPPVRALARDRGVELEALAGTGEHGLITRDDVERAAAAALRRSAPPDVADRVDSADRADSVDSVDGPTSAASAHRETRTPIRSVRKHTAAAMVQSAFTAPHVTEFLTIDVTASVKLLGRLKADRSLADHRIGILALTARALCIAIGRNPSLNTQWDEAGQQIVQFHYVNLGIAAATPRGLVVPNIPDAQLLSLPQLADALAELTASAREGRTPPERLRGGTISITNIGVFGIDAGTPILNPGEAAILALGAVRREPREHKGSIALREVLTLSLSFDHRLVDGEQGSRFLADVGAILRDPARVIAMV